MNVAEATQLNQQGNIQANVTPPAPAPAPTPEATPDVTDNVLEEGGQTQGVSEKVQWLTLFIVGLTVVSLVMNIISNKKQMERMQNMFTLEHMNKQLIDMIENEAQSLPTPMQLVLPKLRKIENTETPKITLPKLKKIEATA